MEQPLITFLCKEQAAEAALNGSSARKAPPDRITKDSNRKQVTPLIRQKLCFVHLPPGGKAEDKGRLRIFAEKMKFTEFFSGKGKP